MNTQKGFAHAVLLIGLLIALIGALGFIFWQNFILEEPEVEKPASSTTKKLEAFERSTEIPADWKKYENKEYKLSFAYPATWTVKENSNGNPDLYKYEIGMGSSMQNYDAVVGINELTLDQTVKRFTENSMFSGSDTVEGNKILSKSKITFDGLPAYEVQYENGKEIWKQYFVNANGYTYDLPYVIESSTEKDRLILLESFRFN